MPRYLPSCGISVCYVTSCCVISPDISRLLLLLPVCLSVCLSLAYRPRWRNSHSHIICRLLSPLNRTTAHPMQWRPKIWSRSFPTDLVFGVRIPTDRQLTLFWNKFRWEQNITKQSTAEDPSQERSVEDIRLELLKNFSRYVFRLTHFVAYRLSGACW